MRICKILFCEILICLTIGCSGIAKMTPHERALTFCDDFMTQYESAYAQSMADLTSDAASPDTKKFVAVTINPKINRLKPLIIDYCQSAAKGGAPDGAAITAMITDISALFAAESKK